MRRKARVGIGDLRLQDVSAFLAVYRHNSVSGAARELGVSVSHVSKAVDRLATQLRMALLVRNAKGIAITAEGNQLKGQLEELIVRAEGLVGAAAPRDDRPVRIAGPSYLLGLLLPFVARQHPEWKLRGIELASGHVRAQATDQGFDAAVTVGATRVQGWDSTCVGQLRMGLFASAAVANALGPDPISVERAREQRFVQPVLYGRGQVISMDDTCPLPRAARKLGYEATTIRLALDLVSSSDQVAFSPVAAARLYVRAKQLKQIQVKGWDVSEPVYLICHQDRVLRRTRDDLAEAMRQALAEPG